MTRPTRASRDARLREPAAITPADRAAALGPERLERLLARGEQPELLRGLFGPEGTLELSALARRARDSRRRHPRGRPLVWLLPGILGTSLGFPRPRGEPPDAVWLDPPDLIAGRALALRHQSRDRVRALGVMDPGYLRLRFRLIIAGYDVEYFGYDWRRGIADLGTRFARHLRATGRPASIVAHSLGGLVARAALRRTGLPPIHRIVMLGTPNFGSYAAVQAMRGSYAVVRRIAMLDRSHDADTLTRQVFSTFASLYDLLPFGPASIALDYHDLNNWPVHGPRPDARRLARAVDLAQVLVPADERFSVIAGIGVPTVVAARPTSRQFIYTYRRDGDGTVPLDSAALPGASLHVAPVAHGLLPHAETVTAAIIDLLRERRTSRLAEGRPRAVGKGLQRSDSELHRALAGKLDWDAMSGVQQRNFLENLSDPGPLRRPARFRSRVASRRRTST